MVSGNMVPSFPFSVVKLRSITYNLLLFTLSGAYSRTCRSVPVSSIRYLNILTVNSGGLKSLSLSGILFRKPIGKPLVFCLELCLNIRVSTSMQA